MDWDKLRIFHAVASAGSFTHAGQSWACRSRRSAARSARWKRKSPRPLFQRHARGLTLTDEGELLFTAVTDVLGRLARRKKR